MHTDPQYSPPSPDLHWKLLMVSDGSDSASKMTFGWALSLNDGTRLAYCVGPAFGRGSSHRAEATGTSREAIHYPSPNSSAWTYRIRYPVTKYGTFSRRRQHKIESVRTQQYSYPSYYTDVGTPYLTNSAHNRRILRIT
jgi:hypothetical protein